MPSTNIISPDISSSAGNLPRAYLNVVFFDERFNFVSENSTSVRVGAANAAANLALTQIKAPENGYCYVYITNESTVSVYFDNLQVRHDRGRIVEENHYYAYGLRINAISSKAYGGPANNYLYQGDFAEFDEDLGWTDFMLRSYDAQIGRFLQNDPYDQFATGYVGMGGDPVNLVDPSGGATVPGLPTPGAIWNGSYLLQQAYKAAILSSVIKLISVYSIMSNFNNVYGIASSISQFNQVAGSIGALFARQINDNPTLRVKITIYDKAEPEYMMTKVQYRMGNTLLIGARTNLNLAYKEFNRLVRGKINTLLISSHGGEGGVTLSQNKTLTAVALEASRNGRLQGIAGNEELTLP